MRYVFIFVMLTALVAIGCKKKEATEPQDNTPTACFQTNSNHYKKMETVHFSNCSANFDRVEWYFGDGGESKYSEPDYKYFQPGTYSIRLKTFNGVNSSETSKNIWIADTMRIGYSLKWDNTTAKNGDMIVVRIYYKKEGETVFTPTFSYPQSQSSGNNLYWGSSAMVAQAGQVDVPNPSNSLQLKIIASCYTYTGSTTLPDFLTAKDSVITKVFDGFSGPAESSVTSTLQIGKLAQQYSMSYR